MIENYTRRIALHAPRNRTREEHHQPGPDGQPPGPVAHYFHYVDRKKAVTENRQAVAGEKTPGGLGRPAAHQPLLHALAAGTPAQDLDAARCTPACCCPRPEEAEERDKPLNAEVDEILVPYGPAVRTALAARAAGNATAGGLAWRPALAQAG